MNIFARRDGSDRSPRPHVGKTALWITAAPVIVIAAVWATFFQRTSQTHMYVVVQATQSLKIEFLQPDPHSVDHCRLMANRVAEAMLAQCATCRLLVSRCLDKLDPRQSKILSGQPVDMPIIRTPTGAVAFISEKPELASEVCRESERQTIGKVPTRCVAAGVASTAISLAAATGNTDASVLPMFSASLVLILFAALMSLVTLYLAIRSGRIGNRVIRNVTATISSLSGSINEFPFVQTAEAGHGVKIGYSTKRNFDIVLALLGIVIFSPFFLLVPVTIKFIDWRCPVIVSIRAVGKGGRLFRMYKFSTMVSDADQVLADLLARDPAMRKEWEENHKLINDPRLLPVIGKFLRKFSINEIPQFFNVLKGEMAMVGPRPISLEEEAKYEQFGSADLLRLRHSIRPGITGLWQISGRNNISYRERVLIDAHYLQNQSLLLDFKILLKTVVVVVWGAGAY